MQWANAVGLEKKKLLRKHRQRMENRETNY